jgi:hypothetical protein
MCKPFLWWRHTDWWEEAISAKSQMRRPFSEDTSLHSAWNSIQEDWGNVTCKLTTERCKIEHKIYVSRSEMGKLLCWRVEREHACVLRDLPLWKYVFWSILKVSRMDYCQNCIIHYLYSSNWCDMLTFAVNYSVIWCSCWCGSVQNCCHTSEMRTLKSDLFGIIIENTTFRWLDSVTVFRCNLLSWDQLIELVPITQCPETL